MKLKKYLIGIFVLGALFALGFFLLNKKVIASSSPQIKTQEILENKFYEPKFSVNSASPLSYETKKQLTIDQGSNSKEYLSAVIYPNFQFGLLGFRWEGDEQTEADIQIKVRFLDKTDNWTKWVAVEKDDNSTGRDTKIQTKISEPVISPESVAFQYKIELTRELGRSPNLDFLKFTCIDSSESITQKISNKISKSFGQAEAASTSGVNIISRVGWGCPDPNNTMFAGTDRYWPAEYVRWQKVVIHHTVTANNDPNPDQTVRNIWEWHARGSNNWGDIGYNFLVSADGRVYQGRFGNNNVVGGHARPYNYGTIGISVLGDYTATGITAPGYESITSLIAQKCRESGFAPVGSSNFAPTSPDWWGRTMFDNMPNIVGHRDCAPTACPGDILYSQLPGIRAGSQNKMYPWQMVSQSADEDLTKLNPGDVVNCTLTAKNTSSNTWSNSGPNPVRLGTWNPKDRSSAFYAPGNWLAPNRLVTMNEASVAPEKNATFSFQMKAPSQNCASMERFNLVIEGKYWMNDIGLGYYCVVSQTYSWQFISQGADRDLSKLQPGEEANITLTAKNTGNTTWSNTGSNPVRVATTNPRDRSSVFAVTADPGKWLGPNRPVSLPDSKPSVAPGETVTFAWKIKAPNTYGTWREGFSLLAEGKTWMNDPRANYYINVAAPYYSWQFISQSSNEDLTKIKTGDQATITLTAKNTGNTTWDRTGSNPIRVGTTNPRDRLSVFANGTWLGPNRPVGLPVGTDSVAPGEQVTFTWTITAPQTGGIYREYFSLLVEGKTWLNDPGVNYYIYSQGTYSWQFNSQSSNRDLANLSPGEQATISLTAKNTGSAIWYRTENNPIRVGTTNPQDRSSSFANNSWLGPNRPAGLPSGTNSVAPGQQVTFTWTITAPQSGGTYREYFSILAEGKTWMNNPGVNYYTFVQGGDYSIKIYGNLGCQARDTNGNVLGQSGNNQILSVGYAGGTYYLKTPTATRSSSLPIRIYPTGGHLILASYSSPNWNGSANYNEFRGILEVHYSPTSNKVWVINELPMEDYMRGIAEAPSGNPEYLKTMVVAARSYAEWHRMRGDKHPGEPFNLNNTSGDQVYKGYGFEYRTAGWPNSGLSGAVNATYNQVVSGHGYRVCITPYSHGARDSTRAGSAIGLNYPWLQAVSDPYGDPNAGLNNPSGNHLVGLSASGAIGYAQNGWGYRSILNHYYSGTGIGGIGNPTMRIAIYGL